MTESILIRLKVVSGGESAKVKSMKMSAPKKKNWFNLSVNLSLLILCECLELTVANNHMQQVWTRTRVTDMTF